mgnify:CR=1 FL=1
MAGNNDLIELSEDEMSTDTGKSYSDNDSSAYISKTSKRIPKVYTSTKTDNDSDNYTSASLLKRKKNK